jgi:hypothetical protein
MRAKVWNSKMWALGLLATASCSDAGQGTATFTTWGEEYIEQGIPADPSGEGGFVDGWSVRYDKFLVVFHAITVANADGKVAARQEGSILVDNTRPNEKPLLSFSKLEAKHWDRVSYQIKPPTEDTTLVSAIAADLDLMLDKGYSIYVSGTAEKEIDGTLVTKTFHWGFATKTQYRDCQQAEESGQALEGLVVTEGGEDVSQLTTHGDHFFYDRLAESSDPAVETALRFEENAAADADEDGEITLEELAQAKLNLKLYNPSGFEVANLGEFMTALARTVGHYRGEGECLVAKL